MQRRPFATLWVAAVAVGTGAPAVAAASAPAPGAVVLCRHVATSGLVGLSDLSVDQEGRLWAVAERQRALMTVATGPEAEGDGAARLVIEGVPSAYDTEAIAWLDATTLAIGTETQVPKRQSDDIFLAKKDGSRAVVFDRIRMPYALWGVRAQSNRGIEGICAAGGVLVAASETVGRLPDGRRAAPVGRVGLADRTWAPFWLPLTTQAGYVSALACRLAPQGDTLTLWAIERHFGIARLLRAQLPLHGDGGVLVSEVWSDLAQQVPGELPNFEGIAQATPGGPVYLITDNHYGRVTGPTELFAVQPPLSPAWTPAP